MTTLNISSLLSDIYYPTIVFLVCKNGNINSIFGIFNDKYNLINELQEYLNMINNNNNYMTYIVNYEESKYNHIELKKYLFKHLIIHKFNYKYKLKEYDEIPHIVLVFEKETAFTINYFS